MGIPSEMRNYWSQATANNHHHTNHTHNHNSLFIASPAEELKILRAKQCTQEGVRAGTKAAAVACVVSAVPTVFSLFIASPAEELKILRAKQCTQEGVRAGTKAAAVACVVSAVPTLLAVRMIPWAKANLNYTAQALIISTASIAAYFITADKTILECARKNTHYDRSA